MSQAVSEITWGKQMSGPARTKARVLRHLPVLRTALAGAVLFGMAGQALAQAVVVRSSGPSAASNPVGKKLPARTRVVLQPADTVTVISGGKTQRLKGPGTFVIGITGAPQGEEIDRLARFITRSGSVNRVRAGAVRGGPDVAPDGPVPAPSVWFMAHDSSGNFCHLAGKRVIMWRELPGDEESVMISSAADTEAEPVEATWGESSRVKSWPEDDVPMESGPYLIKAPGTDDAREISFIPLDELPDEDPLLTAEVLIENGCIGQLDRLIAMGEDEEEADEES